MSHGRTLEAVTLGEAMAAMLAADGRPLRSARLFVRTVAGAELNVAVGLARLEHRCAWIGRVGDDPLGEDICATLRAEGVDDTMVVADPAAPTGLLTRDMHPSRRVRVTYHRAGSAGSRLDPADIDPESWGEAKLLHVTGITPALSPSARAASETAVSVAADREMVITFDPNLRTRLWSEADARSVLAPLAARATVVLASEAEARWLSGCSDSLAATAGWFHDQGVRVVVLKRGSLGVQVSDERGTFEVAAPDVREVDPVGAGDAFNAGFISGLLDGRGSTECARRGVACGAACVQTPGDIEGLPGRHELDDLLADHREADR